MGVNLSIYKDGSPIACVGRRHQFLDDLSWESIEQGEQEVVGRVSEFLARIFSYSPTYTEVQEHMGEILDELYSIIDDVAKQARSGVIISLIEDGMEVKAE